MRNVIGLFHAGFTAPMTNKQLKSIEIARASCPAVINKTTSLTRTRSQHHETRGNKYRSTYLETSKTEDRATTRPSLTFERHELLDKNIKFYLIT